MIDKGIHLYLVGVAAGVNYNDIGGVSRAAGTLTTTYTAGDTFQAGKAGKMLLTLEMRFDAAASIVLKVEGRRTDANNPLLFTKWGVIQLVAMDDAGLWTGTTFPVNAVAEGGELTFTPAAPAGPGAVLVFTLDQELTGDLRISAKAVGAGLTANDYIVVGVDTDIGARR
jgi:hypothetical protein